MTDICAECGDNLAGQDRKKHAVAHWGVPAHRIHRLPAEAAKRYREVAGI